MGLGKTYSTSYLADSNNNTGVAGQVLISTATGINWSDGTDIIGGPYLPLAGGTLTGDLTVGSTSDTVDRFIKVLSGDTKQASLEAYGDSQGTGVVYVGQSDTYGGGIVYNGDGSPAFGNVTTDTISFYRREAGTNNEVFRYGYGGATVTFVGDIVAVAGTFTNDVTIDSGSPELYFKTGASHYSWMVAAQENVDQHFEITPSTAVGGTTFSTPALKINGANNAASFAGTIDATGRVKVTGGGTDQYFYEGARTGVGVTLRMYDNANNIYLDGWAGIALRANQIGGTGGNITLSGGTGGATIIMPNLGNALSDEVTGLMLQGVRHDIIFKQIRTVAATDWNNTTQRIQARVDTTLMQSIDFVTDASYNRHIDINTASNAFNSRFTHNGRLGVGVDNPSQRLEVNGNIYTTGYNQAGNTLIGLKTTGTGAGAINFAALGSNSSATGIAIGRDFNPGSYPDLMISSAGDVGLGIVTALAKFHVVGGNMLATDGLARLSLGAQGATGDVHFGASGMGSPPTGFLQDYGFYSAHNAYRTSSGAWKHSRTVTIGAAMFSGGGAGGSSGTTGFTWNYSANNGSSDITWTRLMEMSTTGALKLNVYGAGVLESDVDGNITSTGNSWNGPYLPLSAGVSNELTGILKLANSTTTGANHIVMGEGSSRYINYRLIDTPDNTGIIYIILCAYAGSNDVNGTIKMDRTSGLRFATSIDVLVSAGSSATPVGGLRSISTAGNGEPNCELVKVTYDPGTGTASEHIAVKVSNPDNYYESTGVYFTGRSSVIGVMKPVAPSEVSSITSFEANTRFNTQGSFNVSGGTQLGDINATVNFGTVALKVVEGTVATGPTLGSGAVGAQAVLYSNGLFGMYTGVSGNGDTWMQSQRNDATTNTYDILLNPAGGRVAIGHDDPTGRLDVYRPDTNYAVNLSDTLSRSGLVVKSSGNYDSKITFSSGGSSRQYIQALNNAATTGRDISINPYGGNVGIGTAGPSYKLDVNQGNVSGTIIKATGIQAQIEIETTTAGDAHLYMRPNSTGNNAAIFKMTAGTNYNWKWQDDATTPAVFMKLQQSTGTLTVSGDVVAYGSPSDKRLKENIKPIESALDKAMKLQGVTFDWKKSDSILDIKEDIGFIAQDVQKVVPELVRENTDGMLSMRHQGIAPILLEAIKELKAEIDLLKSKPCTCNKCNCNI